MDFITGLTSCANSCNALFTCVDHLTKYTVLTACTLWAGEVSAKQVAQLFSSVLSNSMACLIMWSMIGTHVLLQSSGLNCGIPLDLMLSLEAPTTPKPMARRRDNTKRWNRLLDVCWLSSSCLTQNGVTCYIMLSCHQLNNCREHWTLSI